MTRRLTISPDVMFRELEGEAVLLDLKSQRYFGLDTVGTRIWELLADLRQPSAVLEGLLLEFDVSRDRLEKDLEAFLDRLEAAGLIFPDDAVPRQESEDGPPTP